MTSPLRRPRPSGETQHQLPTAAASTTTPFQQQLLDVVQDIFTADATLSPSTSPAHKMFHTPVDVNHVAGYKQAVREPMDLSTIKKFIIECCSGGGGGGDAEQQKEQQQQHAADVFNKLNLMVSNALVFNQGKSNPFRKHAKLVAKAIDEAWAKRPHIAIAEDDKEYVPDEAADDDDDDDFLDEEAELMMLGASGGGEHALEDGAKTVEELKKEQEIPLEELKAQYAAFLQGGGGNAGSSSSSDEDEEEDEEGDDDDDSDDSDESSGNGDEDFEDSSSEDDE